MNLAAEPLLCLFGGLDVRPASYWAYGSHASRVTHESNRRRLSLKGVGTADGRR
jgi:hypothetical protein